MVSNRVFDFVRNSTQYNHGAQLEIDNVVYLISKKSGKITATKFQKNLSLADCDKYEKKGWKVSRTNNSTYKPMAWQDIDLGQVPSVDKGWQMWDEY